MPKISKHITADRGVIYEAENENGIKLVTSPSGARLLDLLVPIDGQLRDLVVGQKTLEDLKANRYFGATIGPVAGRIAGASFTIDGKVFETEDNDHGNTLHGGFHGLDTETWKAETFQSAESAGVVYTCKRSDGDYQFPGNTFYQVTYTLFNDHSFTIQYGATTDRPTLFNPTNHGYFNLSGDPAQPIDTHSLQVFATTVAKTNPDVTTTGEKLAVAETKFDFRHPMLIGKTQLDDPFLLDHDHDVDLILTSPDKKVSLSIKTDEPAIVLYTTGENEANTQVKNGLLAARGAIAIEAQGVPGSEQYSHYGDIVLRPEQSYRSTTKYQIQYG